MLYLSFAGQVHRARLKGQEVVLKVQRPGLKDLFDIDLKNLRVSFYLYFIVIISNVLYVDGFIIVLLWLASCILYITRVLTT